MLIVRRGVFIKTRSDVSPNSIFRLMLAEQYLADGKSAEAEAAIKGARSIDKDEPRISLLEAKLAMLRSEFGSALDNEDPLFSVPLRRAGLCGAQVRSGGALTAPFPGYHGQHDGPPRGANRDDAPARSGKPTGGAGQARLRNAELVSGTPLKPGVFYDPVSPPSNPRWRV